MSIVFLSCFFKTIYNCFSKYSFRHQSTYLQSPEMLQTKALLNSLKPSTNSETGGLINIADLSKLKALNFMRGIMDECTHLGNFTPPIDPSLSIVVTAQHDAYVPRDGVKSIGDLWNGCEVRYIDSGHITAFLFNHGVFRKAIVDGFEKTAQKYYGHSILTEEMKLKQDVKS